LETNIFSAYFLPGVIAIIMIGMGLSLTIYDFKKIFIAPKSLITGLVCQMIILPLIAFTIANLSTLSSEIKVGFVIIAACPGGATSNLITYLLRGNVALSISLTAVNSFLILFSIPIIIYFAIKYYIGEASAIELPILLTILKIFSMIIVPTSFGIWIRAKYPGTAKNIEKYLRIIMPVLLGIVFTFAIFGGKGEEERKIPGIFLEVVPYALTLNIIGMLAGYFIARIMRLFRTHQLTLAIEVGIQNSALAITIASSPLFLNNYYMSVPAIVYGLFTFFSALIFGLIIKRRKKKPGDIF